MSHTQPISTPAPTIQASPFLERLVRFLIPYFTDVTSDAESTRAEILETLASYGARTRSELLNAAQIIAYGLSALDTLHEAQTTEMSPSMRLRYRGCANNLNRSGAQNDQALTKRLGRDRPETALSAVDPFNDLSESDVQDAIRLAQTNIATYRALLSAGQPAGSTAQEEHNKRMWGGAMIDSPAQSGMPGHLAPVA
jgi:hypothetical protein